VRAALSVGASRADADDVAQEAWLALANAVPNARTSDDWTKLTLQKTRDIRRSWLRGYRRRIERESRWEAEIDRHATDAESLLDAKQVVSLAVHAIESLPEEMLRPFILYYREGLTAARVAQLLGVPEGTIRSRLRIATRAATENLRSTATALTSAELMAALEIALYRIDLPA
jgi:RNA polymerase sigma-70 factor (ECF subfamily)